MNPYGVLLELLLKVPEDKRYLLSCKRRDELKGVGECGCLFGTVAQCALLTGDKLRRASFCSALYDEDPFRKWAFSTLLPEGPELTALVREVEDRNDFYECGDNHPDTCAERYIHMVNYLTQRANQGESRDDSLAPDLPAQHE